MTDKPHKETVEEFLARGGKITVLPPKGEENKDEMVRSTTHSPPTLYSLDLGQLMFAEKSTRKRKKAVDITKNRLEELIAAARQTNNSDFTRQISDEKQSTKK